MPPSSTYIFSSDGDLMEKYAIEHRTVIPLDSIPDIVQEAFIIAEDNNYYQHGGISFSSLFRAIIENTARNSWHKKPAGGSTITQQVVKNLIVGNNRTFARKIKEAIMSFRIESSLSKKKILEIYLNHLYLGKGSYGVAEAAETYFGKDIKYVQPHEAAFLAAIPSSPSIYIQDLTSKKLLIKRNSILYKLYNEGYIDKTQLKKSINKPIKIQNIKRRNFYTSYFADEILRQISKKASDMAFFKCGYNVVTTMDSYIQFCATKALEDGLLNFSDGKSYKECPKIPKTITKIEKFKILDIHHNKLNCVNENGEEITINHNNTQRFKKDEFVLCIKNGNNYQLTQIPEITGGIVVMDASNGDILALVGGFSFDLVPFNCITQGIRQTGSIIKPYVYTSALLNGYQIDDEIMDTPVTLTLDDGSSYTPKNFDNKYLGSISFQDGLIYSRNAATVNLAKSIGLDKITNLLKKLNITKKRKQYISSVLGAIEVKPINMLSAFSIFVNNGKMVMPRYIKSITQYNKQYADYNELLDLCDCHTKEIIPKEIAETMQNILHDTVLYGTSSQLSALENKYSIKIIGKTGTSNNCKDAWYIGAFTTSDNKTYIVCVFVGYLIPKSMGKNAYGSVVALPIFANFINNFFTLKNDSSWILS